MAQILPQKKMRPRPLSARLGKQLLEIVTAGMYNQPMMAIREYVQNSADSIDEAVQKGIIKEEDGRIDIQIDVRKRTITIEDNGTGIKRSLVERMLGGLGSSDKEYQKARGFRGIGRLGGLAYCDLLRFETRSCAREKIAVVEWNGRQLRDCMSGSKRTDGLQETIRNTAFLAFENAGRGAPQRFFRVIMVGVQQFHADNLMNINRMRDYLSHCAPVPFNHKSFSYVKEVESCLQKVPGYRSYVLTVNGQKIFKPYCDEVPIRRGETEQIHGVENIEILGPNGDVIGVGWYARMGFRASLPQQVLVRGIRVRQGNIEVGDEYFLEPIYTERRFATWHVGEIHVSPKIKANARRDGFEESKDYERFLEQCTYLGKYLSGLCRAASRKRCAEETALRKLVEVENILRTPLVIDESHYESTVSMLSRYMSDISSQLNGGDKRESLPRRVKRVKRAYEVLKKRPLALDDIIDGRCVSKVDQKKLLQTLCRAIHSCYHKTNSLNELLRNILTPYIKPRMNGMFGM